LLNSELLFNLAPSSSIDVFESLMLPTDSQQ